MAKKSTFAVSFVAQKGKLKSNGNAPIMARITVNGEAVYFSTKLDVAPDRWLPRQNKTVGLTRKEKEMNITLDDLRGLIRSRYNEIVLLGETITASKLKASVLNMDERSYRLLELCDQFIEDYYKLVITNQVTKITYVRYKLVRTRLEEYIQNRYKQPDILVADINHDFIKGFDLWNRTEHRVANNTAARFIKQLRTIYNVALNNGWVRTDPFANYKIKLVKTDRGYLTQQELDAIAGKKLDNKRLSVVRDMFIFSCYTGLAYIDVRNLTFDCIVQRPDGTWWIDTTRQKTNNPVRLMLLDIPLAIIERYKTDDKTQRVLPIPSNQKTNDYLKEIGAICNIEKNLTFHLARHTFATTVTLSNGVPLETVSKLLGHSSTKTTQIYARIVDEKIKNDMNLLAQKINGTAPVAAAQ